nr:MAG TPA: hypothetical protein [Bacteriophage sp.]
MRLNEGSSPSPPTKNNLQNNKKYVIIFIQDKKGAKKWFGLIEAADVNIGGV